MKTICVYCGSSDKIHPDYLDAARLMGATIARRGLELVYGAGGTGLMGALADGALQAGGQVTGVIPIYFNTPR
ncbi:MAG TPA: TIGR00730 family Rossman fold protein, partial [Anaerolineales bacterium]|nr:TIGR00730 family Rossman fold protein [Anaerolineales bacterium]